MSVSGRGRGLTPVPKLGHMIRTGGRTHEFTVGDRLRKAREAAGYDQRAFEKASGISRATISAYELGKSTPKRPYLSIWANVTGTDLDWLMTGETVRQPEDSPTGTEDNDPDPTPEVYGVPATVEHDTTAGQRGTTTRAGTARIKGRGPRIKK